MIITRHHYNVRLVELHHIDSCYLYKPLVLTSLREWYETTFSTRSRRLLRDILFAFDCSEQLSQYCDLDPFPSRVMYHCERDRICYNPTYTTYTQRRLLQFYLNDELPRDVHSMIASIAYLMMCSDSCYYDAKREPAPTLPMTIPSTHDRVLVGERVIEHTIFPSLRLHKKQPLRAKLTRQYTRR